MRSDTASSSSDTMLKGSTGGAGAACAAKPRRAAPQRARTAPPPPLSPTPRRLRRGSAASAPPLRSRLVLLQAASAAACSASLGGAAHARSAAHQPRAARAPRAPARPSEELMRQPHWPVRLAASRAAVAATCTKGAAWRARWDVEIGFPRCSKRLEHALRKSDLLTQTGKIWLALFQPPVLSTMADRGGDRGGFSRGFGRGRGEGGRGGDRGRGDRGRGPRRAPKKDEDQPWVPTTKLGRLVQQARAVAACACRRVLLRCAGRGEDAARARMRWRCSAPLLPCPAWQQLPAAPLAAAGLRAPACPCGRCVLAAAWAAARLAASGSAWPKPSSPRLSRVGRCGRRAAAACTPPPRRRGLACEAAPPFAPLRRLAARAPCRRAPARSAGGSR
jgi:hypothetical protein